MNLLKVPDPDAYERANYMLMLQAGASDYDVRRSTLFSTLFEINPTFAKMVASFLRFQTKIGRPVYLTSYFEPSNDGMAPAVCR